MGRVRRAPATGRMVAPAPTQVDLHVHTSRSDGLLQPLALAVAAAAAGVRTLAITDHDTLAGYRDLVAPGAPPLPPGLDLLAGVEINAVAGGLALPDGELHVVGLGVDPANDEFEATLAEQRAGRRRRFHLMAARLRAAGRGVDAQLADLDLTRDNALGRPTLARALTAAGFARSVPDAFAQFVGQGGPGYVPRQGLGPVEAIRAIRGAGGIPVLAHFCVAPSRRVLLRELMAAGLAGLEVHHRSFDAATVTRVGAVARDLGLLPSGGTDFHGDDETYAEALAETWVPPEVAVGILGALRQGERGVTARQLPALEVRRPALAPALPGPAAVVADARLIEFRPSDQALPRFWVWTLGCQMNRSDSEEIAGRLLAAGCAEAPVLESADLVVINTCAIREAAEAKVIGRQGALAALKAANPALRVVLTGCAVRERDRAGLHRRFPSVDLFLRPDEAPELAERLGLDSAQGPVGPGGRDGGPILPAPAAPSRTAATAVVRGVSVSAADHLAASRAEAVAAGAVRRESTVSAWLPIIYGCDKTCTYCIVPFSRGPERSRPFDEVVDEARALASAGYREITLLGQNVNSYGNDLPTEVRFGHVAEARRAGQRIDRESRPDLAELIRAIDALRGPDGAPAVPRLRFITSHPWDLSDRLVAAMAEAPSVCAALHLPVQSGDDEVLRRMGRQYTIAHYVERLGRIRDAIPGIAVSTDIIVGFCGESDAQYAESLRLLETIRFDQVFAAAYSPRPGTPATHLPDDVPPGVKRERLNRLLALQEEIGFARNRERIGSVASVLVDALERPRGNHPEPGRAEPPAATLAGRDPFAQPLPSGWVRLAGRSRESRLVHFPGPADLLGGIVDVRVEAAGPYSLRGILA